MKKSFAKELADVPEVQPNGTQPGNTGNEWNDLIQDAAAIVKEELPPVVEVVAGLITEQSKTTFASGSKSYKTWFTQHVTLCISHGLPFLERETQRRRVLYVNLELKEATFKRRLQTIARELKIEIEPQWFLHLPLRGKLAGVHLSQIVSRIICIATKIDAGVVVLDPVYKLNTVGDENSSRDQTLLFNELDRITTEARATVILNDHFGKGNQSEKDPLDAIRGSSAKGGDVDAAIILRKHDMPECYRVDVVQRELPPVEPFCIGWTYPLMQLRPDLDPCQMRKAKAGRHKSHTPARLLSAISDTTADNPVSISAWAKLAIVPRQTLTDNLAEYRLKGWVATVGDGNSARQYLTSKGRKLVEDAP